MGAWVSSDRVSGRLYVALAALAWSSAGVVQRSLSVNPATQIVGRAVFACLAIFVFVGLTERGATRRVFRSMGRVELAFAVCMATSSAAFILALNATTVANVLVLQAAAPLLAAVFGRLFLGEQVAGAMWVSTFIALVGVGIMVGGPGGGLTSGILLAAIMAISFAAGIVLARRRSDVSMAPAGCLAQLLLIVCLGPLVQVAHVGADDLLLLAGLGIGQVGLGLVLLTHGARLIPAAEVGLLTQLEIVLGPLWVWLARSETPAPATFAGGIVILAAVVFGTIRVPRRVTAIR